MRHHSSICDREQAKEEPLKTTVSERASVVYPVVIVKVNGIQVRAMLDTGAGSSYISAGLVERLKKRPVRKERKRIEMMMESVTRLTETYEIEIKNLKEDYVLKTEVTKVDRGALLSLPNPNYNQLLAQYKHLQGVKMDDTENKERLPVHLILGVRAYAQIKAQAEPRLGKPGDPVAELTRFGLYYHVTGEGSRLNEYVKDADVKRRLQGFKPTRCPWFGG